VKRPGRELLRDAWRRLRGGDLTPGRAGASVAVGIAIGVMPLWGVHWLLVLAICLPLRLDAGIAYLAANISLPFIAPFITFAEIAVGFRVLTGTWPTLTVDQVKSVEPGAIVAELAVGTLIVAAAGAVVGGTLAYSLTAFARGRARRRRAS
jgi:uncharacterized protein (DUF2062 family)